MARLLNLGCGERHHPDWVNLDMKSANPDVLIADLRRGLPFSSGEFDVVYHSHVLEHLPRQHARGLMDECYRVLRSSGIMRVVIPDLESLAREYLDIIRMIDECDPRGHSRLEWILLELFDQFVRTRPGGEMLEYLKRTDNPDEEYILSRTGSWALPLLKGLQGEYVENGHLVTVSMTTRLRYLIRRVRNRFTDLKPGASDFTRSGERHLWMYDRHSLGRLLESSGFRDISRLRHNQSHIPGWSDYMLDSDSNGLSANPGSLYLEALKP